MTVREIPNRFVDQFSMKGKAEIVDNFHEFVLSTENFYTEQIWKDYVGKVSRGESNYYGSTDRWLYQALEAYPIKGRSVLIFGSVKPWYEAMCFGHGCRSCTVIEHNVPKFNGISNLKYTYLTDVEGGFDVGISISTFEHSGLGRYGDPIDPDADLKAMYQAQKLVRPKGLMYLAVPDSPTGHDVLEWNAMRIYGKLRLALMLKGWRLLYQFGEKRKPTSKDKTPDWYQPVFVLKNKRGCARGF